MILTKSDHHCLLPDLLPPAPLSQQARATSPTSCPLASLLSGLSSPSVTTQESRKVVRARSSWVVTRSWGRSRCIIPYLGHYVKYVMKIKD